MYFMLFSLKYRSSVNFFPGESPKFADLQFATTGDAHSRSVQAHEQRES